MGSNDASNQCATYPSLNGKCVLITGGASGIGASFVEQFAFQGSKVAFFDIQDDLGTQLAHKLTLKHLTVTYFHCDLCNIQEIKSAIESAAEWMGGVDVLINNAANDKRHKTLEVTEQDWHDLISVNLKHQFFCAQACIPYMLQNNNGQGWGSIVNMSSLCYQVVPKGICLPIYNTCKAGIIGLSNSLGREFGSNNIRVNTILPGWIATEKQIRMFSGSESREEILKKTQSLPSQVPPDDVARMGLFLASDDSKSCTMGEFKVDGGWR